MVAHRRLIGLILIAMAALARSQERLPLESFAQLESVSDIAISPDGRYLAAIAAVNHRRTVVILDRTKDSKPAASLGNDKRDEFDIDWCRWANSTRVLCGYRGTASDLGQLYPVTRLAAMDADGKNIKILVQNTTTGDSQFQDQVIDWSPGTPDAVLVQAVAPDDQERTPSVFELDVRTGHMRIRTRSRAPIRRFITDGHGQVRVGTGYDGKKIEYFARLDGHYEWRQLAKFEAFSDHKGALEPFAVEPKSNILYGSGDSDGRNALWKFDLEDRDEPQLIFGHPLVDVEGAIQAKDGRMIGVTYHTEEPHAYYLDPYFESIATALSKALPGRFNEIVDMTQDQKTFVIRSSSDVDAGHWLIFDTVTGHLDGVSATYPDLPESKMAHMRWIHYPAKDGTPIPGYLTLPLGAKAGKLPLIVMPHGGPYYRDTFSFDFLRQFLANRGYAVLQMNFRGSSGYGSKWFYAAHQDWGGLTYSDIADATRWAVSEGIADPSRICIVGWSFGGYAALLGAVRDSQLYRCAVSIAGVSDLQQLISDERGFTGYEISKLQIGTDWEKLKRDSPRRHAQDTNIPVLLVHGSRDYTVPEHHSDDMASALKRAGKKYQYVEIEGGSHQLWREAERIKLLQSVEKFLADNLGASP